MKRLKSFETKHKFVNISTFVLTFIILLTSSLSTIGYGFKAIYYPDWNKKKKKIFLHCVKLFNTVPRNTKKELPSYVHRFIIYIVKFCPLIITL